MSLLFKTPPSHTDEYLHSLNQIQRKWVYLEPIFGRGALPTEQARFQRVDAEFRAILAGERKALKLCDVIPMCVSDVAKDDRLVSLCNRTGLRSTLQQLLDQLGRCQKSLNEFLEVLFFQEGHILSNTKHRKNVLPFRASTFSETTIYWKFSASHRIQP